MESGWKPTVVEISPACPRCGSSNTKFCYYNNYSLTQPRYFCKRCRRYWTKGGSLRNVPIGGGCRKSRRGKSIRASTDRNSAHNRFESNSPITSGTEASTSNNNIDLAAVYANFVNLTPRPQNHIEIVPELHQGIVVPPIEFSNFDQLSSHLSQENGLFECRPFPARLLEAQLFGPGGGDTMFTGGLNSFQNQQFPTGNSFTIINPIENDLLPPLPGEEVVVSEGMVWPNSDVILQNQILHSDQEVGGEVQPEEQHSKVVSGNMGPFCGLNLEAFFRS